MSLVHILFTSRSLGSRDFSGFNPSRLSAADEHDGGVLECASNPLVVYGHSMNHPEEVARGFQDAWNAHDMQALKSLFHEDATFVNRFGHYVKGANAIAALHAPIHQTIYSDSTLVNEVIDTVPIGDEAAVVHFWSRLKAGAAHPAGVHSVDTLILAVLTRSSTSWRIKALENVTLTNPRTGEIVLRS
jgi:uncharacterized protein (TIGR02246 family)